MIIQLIYWLPDHKIAIKKFMNKILPLIILFSTLLFPQQSSLLHLHNSIDINSYQTVKYESPAEMKKKNAGLAIIYSLILPGMGELYADNYSSGKYFTIAEGTLWLTYTGINTYGGWMEDRYKSFAVTRGGIDPTGKDADYYATISEYFSIEEYNNEQALNRNFSELYSEEYYWNWQTPADRRAYRSMWVSSEQSFNNLRFVVGGLILNRLISAINAVRSVTAYNKRLTEESWNISVSYSPDINNPGLRFNFFTPL
jgi:hypothetical protein